ncbi:MAG: hypothetical protein KGZ25_09630, partial [Planctomycetes bacterium]|nr:hypothetical protein [Planctomycetota bacterium]
MYPKWDKKRSIVAAAVVSVCIAGIFFVYLSEGESDVAQEPPSHGQKTNGGVRTDQEKGPVFTKIDDPLTEILDSPGISEEQYGKKLVAQIVKQDREGGTGYPFSWGFDYKKNVLYDYDYGAPKNAPKLFLRFRCPDADGGLSRCAVTGGTFKPLEITNDDYTYAYQYKQEPDGFSLDVPSKKYVNMLHEGREDEYDPSKHGPYYRKGGYGVVLLLSQGAPLKYDSLIMGRTYGMTIHRENDKGKHIWSHTILRVPEDVPEGKTVVKVIDVTEERDWREMDRAEPKKVSVKLKSVIPEKGKLLAGLWDAGREKRVSRWFKGEEEVVFEVLGMGGELGVIHYVEPEKGYVFYYKRRVKEQEVTLPKDADLVVDPDEVLSFRIKIPQNEVPYDSTGMSLLMHRDSTVPIGGAEFANVESWDRSSKKPPSTLPLMAPPGNYHVAYGFDAPKVIGKITVKKSDAGKT